MNNMTEFEFLSHDGSRFFGYDWPSYQHSRAPYAVVISLHGPANHTGWYDELAHFFNENN
ncbi:unnamed protein product, partial [Rotaria magnacalcarata]